jgi:putative CocE/NonD family hydrolase
MLFDIRKLGSAAASALILAIAAVSPARGAAGEGNGPGGTMSSQFNLRVPMRDGVMLSTDVYRPAAPGRYPALLIRTCYTKGTAAYAERAKFWTSHGYVLVVQDVRGRGDSDGSFYPAVNEARDGFDVQSWIAAQPWSDGKVGTLGASYLGWTQVYPAGLDNPALKAMIPTVTPPDPNRSIPIWHGSPLPAAAAWLASVDGHTMQDLSAVDVAAAYSHLPAIDMDKAFGRDLKAWRDWVRHPLDDDYWKAQAYQERYLDASAPALNISGWYDDVLVGTTENYIAMTTRGRKASARNGQWLVIGPWGHQVNTTRKLGDIDFGPQALIDMDALQLRWFDHWLKGEDNGADKDPRVKLFVMGANVWTEENEWPIARTRYTKFFLHSGGKANSLAGDGVLSIEAPGAEPPDRYRYDPADPTPYMIGLDWKQVGGPDDNSEIEKRKDVLVYTTAPFKAPVRVCGPLKVKLFAATSTRDTDWMAKVLDVHPDGYAQRLNDGMIRARFRRTEEREELVTPGEVAEYDIDAWATCIELQPGHRLRLEIASAAQGKFDLNLNTGGPIGQEAKGVAADQTIRHDAQAASYLLLPIVPARTQ